MTPNANPLTSATQPNETEFPKLSELQQLFDAGRVLVTTREAASILGLKPQTLHKNACYQTGPLQPVRVGKRLRWKLADIIYIVGGVV